MTKLTYCASLFVTGIFLNVFSCQQRISTDVSNQQPNRDLNYENSCYISHMQTLADLLQQKQERRNSINKKVCKSNTQRNIK